MMIEGTVDVSGSTVKIDSTEKIQGFYGLARNALADCDYESAANTYATIAQENPTSWEAVFYSSYCRAMLSKRGEIDNVTVTFGRVAKRAIQLAFSYLDDAEAREEAIEQITEKSLSLASVLYENTWVLLPSLTIRTDADLQVFRDRQKAIFDFLVSEGYAVLNAPNTTNRIVVSGVNILKGSLDIYLQSHKGRIANTTSVENYSDEIKNCAATIQKYDPDFRLEKYHEQYLALLKEASAESGCYIATAVYGSYNCPQVWTLRRYRDYKLAKTWYGRVFIRTYYAISPSLVAWFGDTTWFKKMWRNKLDHMVVDLKIKGFEDTPYQDKNW